MSSISENTKNSDSEIIAQLRKGLEQSDPVPADVAEFARALWSWRDIDAELAELSFDSASEPTPTGVRSTASVRVLSFDIGDMSLDVEHNGATGDLMGQLSTDQPFTVELHAGGAQLASEPDELGRFDFENVPEGPVSIVIHLADGRVVKTIWITL